MFSRACVLKIDTKLKKLGKTEITTYAILGQGN